MLIVLLDAQLDLMYDVDCVVGERAGDRCLALIWQGRCAESLKGVIVFIVQVSWLYSCYQ